MRIIADVFARAVLAALPPVEIAKVRRMVEGHRPGAITYVTVPDAVMGDDGMTDVAIHLWDEERIAIRAAFGPVGVHSGDGHIAVNFGGTLPSTVCTALVGRDVSYIFSHRLVKGVIEHCGPSQTPGVMKAMLRNDDEEMHLP